MACYSIRAWTFCGLVGAFLDLALTYLLLCGSAIAFFASKFLGVFRLHLPCPCNGFFGVPNGGKCLQRLLVDCPTRKMASVQMSVKSKFPFDTMWMEDEGCHSNFKFLRDRDCCDGLLEMKGEASCSSFSSVSSDPLSFYSASEMGHEISEESSMPVNSGADDLQDASGAPGGISVGEGDQHNFKMNVLFGESKTMEKDAFSVGESVFHSPDELDFDGKDSDAIRVLEQALQEEQAAQAALYIELEKERSAAATAADEAMAMILRLQKEKASIEMEARQYQRMIEEKSAYDAEEMDILKEILIRREREKHFLEREVEFYRQILHFGNEKLKGDEHELTEISGQRPNFLFDLSEDPVLLLQRINESIGKREIMKSTERSSDNHALTVEEESGNSAFVKDPPSADWDEDANFLKRGNIQRKIGIGKHYLHAPGSMDECRQDFQEKGMISMYKNPCALHEERQTDARLYTSNSLQAHTLLDKSLIDEKPREKNNAIQCQVMAMQDDQNDSGNEFTFSFDGENLEKHGKNADLGQRNLDVFMHDKEASPHDVHIVENSSKLYKEGLRDESELLLMNKASKRSRNCPPPLDTSGDRGFDSVSDCASTSKVETEPDIHQRSSEMTTSRMTRRSNSHGRALPSCLRRNSMSAVDNERLKLDTEVGWLRERLRVVQEGRERLASSMEHREKEKLQLKLLEDITNQLQEIQKLKEPRKAVRRASLPPSSLKACCSS
ncbi:PREDICTED: uncharacterized protein LOC104602201 [Nelumbo nucifera]|uniref:Uncharacterized protein LOC104602201 n=1 Tax=Nelumbo nucifera TaxID=4432 RepID=A0A1U8A9L7_NELNU|nr:PREDICTED: uncharacterized protein LOC104602201 [Nelumbo nucifera]XP_010264113.1 PREDICTED: uncharacterized protein LOC104602201 [Nelumbo nucifera]